MTNPVGAFLPGDQASLEREWKRGLAAEHGIAFDALIVLTNMPISRFLEWLEETGNLEATWSGSSTPSTRRPSRGLMCRNTLSVGWDGRLYDCDFNQMLELPALGADGARVPRPGLRRSTRSRRARS